MALLTQKERNGLMVAVITGGRPALRDRPTAKYLDDLKAAGHPVCWVLGDWDAPEYEHDKHEHVVYTRQWAEQYAALATNGRTVGAQLNSVPAQKTWIRTGFPYSIFVERILPDRGPWFGPFEDDIMHSLQYASRATSGTALIMPFLKYGKEAKKMIGMRKNYNHERSKALGRVFPEVAKTTVIRGKSNGAGAPRVFHKMTGTSIRTPMVIKDRGRFAALQQEVESTSRLWAEDNAQRIRKKMEKRAGVHREEV